MVGSARVARDQMHIFADADLDQALHVLVLRGADHRAENGARHGDRLDCYLASDIPI